MRNKRGSVLCLGLVAAMMPFASSLQASSLTDHVCDVAVGMLRHRVLPCSKAPRDMLQVLLLTPMANPSLVPQ